ncbi:MAG: hypothetical protein HKN25_03715 [Pyrinomonadaceae bacterium]|nr:hypothetical protein [Pyrinomonadaceae bacterium]
MINHISIGVKNPENVAKFLAELWKGFVFPFPPSPDSFIVIAGDGKGTAVEITPINIVLKPGKGFPSEIRFDKNTLTEEFEAKFVPEDGFPDYLATHLAINTELGEVEVKELARRENWRTLTCNRGEGLFQLIEVWVENRFLLEVFTPEMTRRYIEVMDPKFMADMNGAQPRPALPSRVPNLDLIGFFSPELRPAN